MTLTVDVRHRLGAFDLDVAFGSGGGLTALFGPSGSGKTSLVNIIGGLILGVAETLAVILVGSAYKDGVSLLIIVLVLLVRPNGLFGSPAVERS